MAALLLRAPELVISKDEATKLAEALRNLAQYYQFAPDPRVMAWVQIIGVAAVIYGPRIVIISKRAKAQRDAANARGPIPANMVVTPTAPPKPNGGGVPGAFDNPPPPSGVYKFQ